MSKSHIYEFNSIVPALNKPMASPTVVSPLPTTLQVKDGEALEIKCEFSGDPEPQVSWTKSGEPLTSSDVVALKYRNRVAVLTIPEVFPEDEATYVCTAVNSMGKTSSQCVLKVLRKFLNLLKLYVDNTILQPWR